MTWFKVDDSFYDHPKVFDAPDSALALWVRAGCWSARNLTDGFVPASLPARICDDPDTAVRVLVDRGLWKRTRGGYQFHDWTEYQPTAEAVKDLRSKRAEAGRKGGQAKAAKVTGRSRKSGSYPVVTSESRESERDSDSRNDEHVAGQGPDAKQNASKPVANARGVAKQNAAPSRPVPSRRDGGTGSQSSSGGQRARENDDDDEDLDKLNEHIEGRIIELLVEHTGRAVDRVWASKVRHQILDDRQVANPLGYVASCIRGEPGRYVPAEAPADKAGNAVIRAVRMADPDQVTEAAHRGAAEARALLGRKP